MPIHSSRGKRRPGLGNGEGGITMLTFGSHVDGYYDVSDQMIHDLRRRAEACLRAQAEAKARIGTVAEFEAHRERVRAAFLEAIGGLPAERTPLQAEVTGRIDRGAYTIE